MHRRTQSDGPEVGPTLIEKAPSPRERKIIVVLGMHRSGTSAITRGLQELGVGLGTNLMPASAADNPTGFWEDMDIYNLSERLLERLSSRWDSVAPIGASSWERPDIAAFRLEAIDLVSAKAARTPIWGFKDPRTVPLLPFWKSVFKALDMAPCYVIAIRNPLSVARSLEARDAISLEKSLLLWLQHSVPVVSETAGNPRVVVDYDRLMDDAVRELQRIAAALGLEAPKPEELATSEYVREFLSQDLRHTRYKPVTLDAYPALAGLAKEVYELLLQPAQDRLGLDELQRTDGWVLAARIMHEFGAFAEYLEDRENQLQKALTEKAAQAQSLSQREAEIHDAQLAVTERESQIANLSSQIEQVKDAMVDRDRQITTFKQNIADLHAAIANRDAQIADGKQAIADLREMADVKQIVNLHQILGEQKAELAHLSHTLAERDSAIANLNRALAERDTYLHALRTSTSWLVTAPIRSVKRAMPTMRWLLAEWLRALYLASPLPVSLKLRVKSVFFAVFSPFLRNTMSYRRWLAFDHGLALSPNQTSQNPSDGQTPQGNGVAVVVSPASVDTPILQDKYTYKVVDQAPPAPLDSRALASSIWFHEVSHPWVSIIIPVYNHIDLTTQCLKSVSDVGSRYSFEVLVIDDCSTDDTYEILGLIPGLHLERNATNLGFTKSCNRAASLARGQNFVFLNNDTMVTEGWLDMLVQTLEEDVGIGLVGGKLVYPNGKLQEAGGIIWRDGSGANVGRDDDPAKPQYNYLREVDYCSGACIIISRGLFQQLGGFDERYAPAYYEDTDLAFKVRERGLRVVYQPFAVVVHYEGGTAGTDLTKGTKAYQVVNAQKFLDRWRETLATHGDESDGVVRMKDRWVVGRALVVDVWPTPDRDSGSMDALNLLKALIGFRFKVTFFPANTLEHFGDYTTDLQKLGVECLYAPYVESLEQYLRQSCQTFDVVFLRRAGSGAPYMEVIRTLCPGATVIFDTVDLHYVREQRRAELEGLWELKLAADRTKELELAYVKNADATIVVSPAEKALLEEQVPDATVFCIPFSRDIPGREVDFDHRTDILFVGGYLHEPNVDAVTYFVSEIWPSVAARLPDARFLIVGSNMPNSFSELAGDRVVPIGYVKNLSTYLSRSRLTVAPLRYGAGIKGKIVTSLSHGVPVVASALAVEGMECADGQHVLVAEAPDTFAEQIVRVYSDEVLWTRLSDEGLCLVKKLYSHEAGRRRLAELLCHFNHPVNVLPHVQASAVSAVSVAKDTGAEEAEGILRLIAFYLPQFHPIPENDKWWGKGFTEWTNVTRALPLFPGHYQPHLPGELSFYDLRVSETREAQAALARQFGIYGFCYYHYWFAGKRLLQRPFNEVLTSGKPNFPFCLCWANESWTRRWDGREQHILMEQEHTPASDVRFIRDILPALRDERYIRINGRPLLLVYRTELLPNPKATAEAWREECVRAGVGDPYLCRGETFHVQDPSEIGFDAAYEFPPLNVCVPEITPETVFAQPLDPSNPAFTGKLYSYQRLVETMCARSDVPYKRFQGVMVGWDNTARRKHTAHVWLNGSPEVYENWLRTIAAQTMERFQGEERLVFVNAWNEWAEGCHLEPDQRYGRLYLEATFNAVDNLRPASRS